MAQYRLGRINDEMQKELSTILRDVKDPRVSSAFISITAVETTPDLKFAKVFYSALSGDKKEIAKGLKSSAGYIRRQLAQSLNLRMTPELTFAEDHSIEHGAHISKLLEGIEVRLNIDYLQDRNELNDLSDYIIYTGPIDAYFDYKLGHLEYRSVRFETELMETDNYQGNAVVNYTDRETSYTRIIEHKWFEFGKDINGDDIPKTVISKEYSSEWNIGDEPYYPVNDEKNNTLYKQYKELADKEEKVLFGGRLGEYKYYDMDQVVEKALVAFIVSN